MNWFKCALFCFISQQLFAVTVTTEADSGAGSLREAVDNALATATTNIDFDPAVNKVDLSSGISKVSTDNATINIDASSKPTIFPINMNGTDPHFIFGSNVNTTISFDNIDLNSTSSSGGGLFNVRTLVVLQNSSIRNCINEGAGGIFAAGSGPSAGGLTLKNVQIDNCQASTGSIAFAGGVVILNSETDPIVANLTNVNITNCSASSTGQTFASGILIFPSDPGATITSTLNSCTLDGCSSTGSLTAAGAITILNGAGTINATMNNTIITNSNAVGSSIAFGGGLSVSADTITTTTVTMQGLDISNCFVQSSGGAAFGGGISAIASSPTMLQSTFQDVTITDCQAIGPIARGGAIAAGGASFLVMNTTFTNTQINNCSAVGSQATGGGVSLFGPNDAGLFMENTVISNCSARNGGAIFIGTGATLVLSGTLSLQNNHAIDAGQDIFIEAGGGIAFNLQHDFTMPSPIEGEEGIAIAGGLSKAGARKLTLVGENTYSGTTVVIEGELEVDGSILDACSVQSGGILSGNAMILPGINGTGSVVNEGIVRPGSSGEGAIVVTGQYDQVTGGPGTLEIDISGAESGHTFLQAGSSMLGGDLIVNINDGNYIAGTSYNVVSGPSTGTFNPPIKQGTMAGQIDINVTYGSAILTVNTTSLFQHQNVNSGNPQQVSNALISENIPPNSPLANLVIALGQLDDVTLNKVLNQMSPAPFGALEWINLNNNSLAARVIANHQNNAECSIRKCCSDKRRTELWVNAYGSFSDEKQFRSLIGYDANAGGFIVGADHCIQDWIFGGGIGYSYTNFDWDCNGGNGQIYSLFGALYGSINKKWFAFDVSVLGGGDWTKLRRKVTVPMIEAKAKSKPGIGFFTTHLGGKLKAKAWVINVQPFGALDYHYMNVSRFKESDNNTGIALDVRNRNSNMLRTELGCAFSKVWKNQGNCVTPYAALSWVRKIALSRGVWFANFVGQAQKFKVVSFYGFKDFISPEFGLKVVSMAGFSFSVGYKGEFGGQADIHQADARLELVF